MKAKLNNFLQSNVFILSVALIMGFLCHFLVTTDILAADKKERSAKSLYASVFDFEPLIGKKLQSLELENDENLKLSHMLESNLNISLREDDNYKYVDIETYDNKSLKIDINQNFINIQKKVEKTNKIEKENEKIYSSYASIFS